MILHYAPVRAGVLRRAVQRTSRAFLRRQHQQTHSAKSTIAEPESLSSPPVKAVPSPTAWIWTEPINAYSRFHGRRPYLTQLVSTLTVYLVGDLISQRISPSPARDDEATSTATATAYDPFRTARALIIGGIAAVPGYKWFVWLSNSFNYSSKALSLVVKIGINQMVFTPVFNSYFFGMQSLLTGASLSEIVERIKHTVPKSWLNSWKVWPAVMAFNFTYVPLEFRSIFGGVVAIGWQTYLSLLNQRAARLQQQAQANALQESRIKAAA